MKFAFSAAFIVAAVTSAYSQDKQPQFLTVEQAIRISNGLAQLDCFQPMDGGISQGCKKRYDIGLVTLSVISRNIEKGTAVFNSYQKAITRRRQALQNDKGELDKGVETRLEVENREALEASSGVAMEHIRESEVLKESTPMPGTVLAMIRPILD